MAHMTKTGRGGASIPYSSLANLIKGSVRSYGRLSRIIAGLNERQVQLNTHYLRQTDVANLLLEELKESLDGICREEDMIAVAVTIADLCKNSTFVQKK